MKNTIAQMTFPDIGKRSPILKFYAWNLRRAYYFTNALIFLAIILVFGYVKWQQWQQEQNLKKYGSTSGKRVITLTYAQLGPPPSLAGDESAPQTTTAARASAPTMGVPKPVPDALAAQETAPTQQEIAGVSALTGTGEGTSTIQVEAIPDINAYVPHEVEPKVTYQPALEYPSIARMLDQEGTVFIKALVDLNGTIMRVVIMKSSGYPMLDSAAVRNVYDWKCTPALQSQKPVRVWVGAPVRFVLKKTS